MQLLIGFHGTMAMQVSVNFPIGVGRPSEARSAFGTSMQVSIIFLTGVGRPSKARLASGTNLLALLLALLSTPMTMTSGLACSIFWCHTKPWSVFASSLAGAEIDEPPLMWTENPFSNSRFFEKFIHLDLVTANKTSPHVKREMLITKRPTGDSNYNSRGILAMFMFVIFSYVAERLSLASITSEISKSQSNLVPRKVKN